MILTKLISYGLMAIFLAGNAFSMDDNNKTMIIGCRPWDNNMREFNGLNTAHFVDRMLDYGGTPPKTLPINFHHLDLNNTGLYSSGNFSNFATDHIGQFQTIILDWTTYHAVLRDGAWEDCAKLLSPNGSLIVPIANTALEEGRNIYGYKITVDVPASRKRAEEFIIAKNFVSLFGDVKIFNYEDTLQDARFDLLRRPNLEDGRLNAYMNVFKAVIIVATK
jgi:hypothetical protein